MPMNGTIVCKIANVPQSGEANYETLLGETMRLSKENRQLKRDNDLLRSILAEAIGTKVIVIREEAVAERRPKFRIDENLAGDILITCL